MFSPHAILTSLYKGDKSAHISGESRNQTVLFWHAKSICILQITLSFSFCLKQQIEPSCHFPKGMFCVTTKGSASQTAAKKTSTSLLMCTVQEGWLLSHVTSVNLSNLFGSRLTMLMSILNCTHEQDYAFSPYGFSNLAGVYWISWQKKLYLFTFAICASKGVRACPDQKAGGESDAAIWFSLVI